LLAEHFLNTHRREDNQGPQGFSAEAREKLLSYSWPGNIRELENVVAQTALGARGRVITAEDLVLNEVSLRPAGTASTPEQSRGTMIEELFAQQSGQVFAAAERLLVAKALELTRHNQVHAARLLGISRNVLRDRMKRYGLA
jgi:DNA-binding NtrC family response regulator